MCGRYYLGDTTKREVEIELGQEMNLDGMKAGDVTPAMSPIVLTAPKGGQPEQIRATSMFWGISRNDKKLVINARSESVFEKTYFSDSVMNRRLIIPAAGFYEWDKDKNKVSFFRKDKKPIYLAGFYQLSENKDSFVILTTSANESMIKVHDRMPLMIERQNVMDWLVDTDAARQMLTKEMPLLDKHQDYEQLSLF